ncbi:hypothetical protein D3C85_1336280 [compost metagenome]
MKRGEGSSVFFVVMAVTGPSSVRVSTAISLLSSPLRVRGSWLVAMNWTRGNTSRRRCTMRIRQRGCKWASTSSISTMPSAEDISCQPRRMMLMMSMANASTAW